MPQLRCLILCIPVLLLVACQSQTEPSAMRADQRFHLLPGTQTGIDFSNDLPEDGKFDVFRYRNYYNGGGVAIGDIDNDGLSDVYLVANAGSNKLYKNLGGLQFQDISAAAGTEGQQAWSTGVAMADVNADGYLDIYVCNSGNVAGDNKRNELFINQQDGTFTEEGAAYGIDDEGFGTHGVFFDYDLDGDLDLYLLNNSFRPVSTFGLRNIRHERDQQGGDKLYRNEGGRFSNVSEEAGIYGSVIGFGLGVTVGDVNVDGWPDLYISNDFFERDYLYINQGDGTFAEELPEQMGHLSFSSMGADMADLNADGYPEIFVTDMLPAQDTRLKMTSTFESYDVYQAKLRNDYYHQFMQNTLQRNNGNGTFSEIAHMAGVAKTDWSWGALMADLSNNGQREILVCNGVYKDVTDQDFINYLASDENLRSAMEGKKIDFKKWIDIIPSNPISNFLFERTEQGGYQDQAAPWGLGTKSFSNGAAYGDLDNDGDLDLVINNVNMPAFCYQNRTVEMGEGSFLQMSLEGPAANPFGLGTRITAHQGRDIILYEHMPMRGFQSSMDYRAHMGFAAGTTVDSLLVRWPDGRSQVILSPQLNQTLTLRYSEARETDLLDKQKRAADSSPLLTEQDNRTVNFSHQENPFIDFDRDRMLYQMLSREGPALAVADLTSNGQDDFFIGGAKGQTGRVMMQRTRDRFMPDQKIYFGMWADSLSEDVAATFFDADGDGDQDLYVVSGGAEFATNASPLADRLYINFGGPNKPLYKKSTDRLPVSYHSGACVRAVDYDLDGDLDLFVGTRSIPRFYGVPASSQLLQNDGKGYFTEVSKIVAPALDKIGMVTDAQWADLNGDQLPDLILVGDWMPVTVLLNSPEGFRKAEIPGLDSYGWWKRLLLTDVDADGDLDIVAGNYGLNSKFQASASAPLRMLVYDFDHNRTAEQIYVYQKGDSLYPMPLRHELVGQLNYLKKKFIYHKDYATATINQVFTPEQLAGAFSHQVTNLETSLFINEGVDGFRRKALPREAQISPVYGIVATDINQDGHQDLILAGNFTDNKPEIGRQDAGQGLLLLGQGGGDFRPLLSRESGLQLSGQVRQLATLRSQHGRYLLAAKNNDQIQFFKWQP